MLEVHDGCRQKKTTRECIPERIILRNSHHDSTHETGKWRAGRYGIQANGFLHRMHGGKVLEPPFIQVFMGGGQTVCSGIFASSGAHTWKFAGHANLETAESSPKALDHAVSLGIAPEMRMLVCRERMCRQEVHGKQRQAPMD